MKDALRSMAGVLAGLFLITLIAETIEFGVVTLLNGAVTTDQAAYFGIRNQPGVLAFKLLYNSAAAFAGGFACAWIAGRMYLVHGALLAVVQVVGLVYGMSVSEFAATTPRWMWIALLAISAVVIPSGAVAYARRAVRRN